MNHPIRFRLLLAGTLTLLALALSACMGPIWIRTRPSGGLTLVGRDVPAAAASPLAQTAERFRRIEARELQLKVQGAAKVFVFDANDRARFDQGHVPGAAWLTADAVAADKLPPDKDAMLVFYCGSATSTTSHRAADKAIDLGYSNVWVMPDGIQGWEAQGLATEPSRAAKGR